MDETTEGQTPEVTTPEPRVYDEAHVKSLNAEAAKYRVERNELRKTVEDLTARVKSHDDEGKSELEKLASKVAEYETKLAEKDREMKETAKRSKIMIEVSKLPVIDPDAVYRLLDVSAIEAPTDIGKAITALLKEKPYLVKESGPPTPGAGGAPLKSKKSADEQFAAMLRQAVRK
jgi:seryl-tRNA synthetase